MNRRKFGLMTATALAGLLPGGPAPAAAGQAGPTRAKAAKQRNIVLIIADDHGADIGVYGNRVVKTPNLDALARDGVRFTNAFATTASCSASRSVLLTGLQNHRTAQYGHAHDFHHFSSWDYLKSLPVLLRNAGYRTGRVGKFHVLPSATYAFETTMPAPERDDLVMAENTRPFINSDDSRPFFLYFAFNDPHRGARANAEGVDVGLEDIDTPDNFGNRPGPAAQYGEIDYDPAKVEVPSFLPDTPQVRRELANYYRSVSRIDSSVGKLVEILKKAGKYDDTLIIYMSDHGIAFPGAKTTTYDPGLRIPLLVHSPDVKKRGVTNDAMISMVDIAPTLLDYAQVEPPSYKLQIGARSTAQQMTPTHGLHGRSFLPILDQQHPSGWDEIYASHTFHEIQMYYPMRVVRDRRYKLIWNIAYGLTYPFASDLWESPSWQHVYRQGPDAMWGKRTVEQFMHRPEFELYDIQKDPNEARNLADDPAHAELLAAYKEKIRQFQINTQDPWLSKWIYQ